MKKEQFIKTGVGLITSAAVILGLSRSVTPVVSEKAGPIDSGKVILPVEGVITRCVRITSGSHPLCTVPPVDLGK